MRAGQHRYRLLLGHRRQRPARQRYHREWRPWLLHSGRAGWAPGTNQRDRDTRRQHRDRVLDGADLPEQRHRDRIHGHHQSRRLHLYDYRRGYLRDHRPDRRDYLLDHRHHHHYHRPRHHRHLRAQHPAGDGRARRVPRADFTDGNSGDQQLTATDNTATGAGWHITVSATTFTTGPRSLPNTGAVDFTGSVSSSVAGTAPTATCVGTCTLPTDTSTYPVVMTTAVSSPTAYTVYDTAASTGEGVMTIGGSTAANPIGWWVQVPAATYAGLYTSTVTLQVVSGP